MTGIEYLKVLQNLASFSHSEPIPQANKTWQDQLEDLLSPSQRDQLVKMSREIRPAKQANAYGSESVDTVHDREYHWNTILNDLMERIRRLYTETNVAMPSFPCLGVLPIGVLDAAALRVPHSSEYLVVFNEGAFLFLYIFAKIVTVTAFDPGTSCSQKQWNVQIPEECREKFRELFLAYVLHGKPDKAEPWLLDPRYLITLQNVVTAAELFLLAHEIKHVTSDDLRDDSPLVEFEYLGAELQRLTTSFVQELLADVQGAMVTMTALSQEMNVFIVFSGIELAICARKLIENALRFFQFEEIPAKSILDNPRSLELHRQLIRALGKDTLPVIQSGLLTRIISQMLWEDVSPQLIALRAQGASPAVVWSPPF